MNRKSIALLIAITLAMGIVLVSTGGAMAESSVWSKQVSGTSVILSEVNTADASHVWAVGQAGVIRYTANAGTNWGGQVSGIVSDLSGITSAGLNKAWAVGDGGVIRYTGNAGGSWGPQSSGTLEDLSSAWAVDENHVWVVGWNGVIRHTDFGGATWWGQASGTLNNLWAVTAADANHAWAVGNFGTIVHTDNGGVTWGSQASGTNKHLRDVCAADANNVWAVGDTGTLLYTSNGGQSWAQQASNTTNDLRGVSAAGSGRVWVVGFSSTILFSSDNGGIWTKQTSPVSTHLFGLDAPDSSHAFASDWDGNIIAGTVTCPTWYLAEGTTAWGFSTYISIENPNNQALTASVTYNTDNGAKPGPDVPLPPMSQTTVNPETVVPEQDFSTVVTCKEGKSIAVDRTMSWTGTGAASPEAHSSIGVTATAKTWYLPEGSSKWGFETWLLIQNPNAAPATCTVTYMIEGESPRNFTKTVPASSRKSFNMVDDIGEKDASIKVVSTVPVIPERAMYRNNRREGHDSIGTTAPAADYYLAEGTTAWGFTTYVLVQNPQATPTDVTITYMTPSGPKPQAAFSMPANSRRTIRVNDIADVNNTDLSTRVHGSQPIIAERAMYWDNGTGEACHDSIGMASSHTTFYLPDGETSNGRETWTLVQNPNNTDVSVQISYLTPNGQGNVTFAETVPANSRKTYSMVDKGIGGRAAVRVTSKTSGKRIMVERAMYWNSRGVGTDTVGGYAD